jgi:hypothetical protein
VGNKGKDLEINSETHASQSNKASIIQNRSKKELQKAQTEMYREKHNRFIIPTCQNEF